MQTKMNAQGITMVKGIRSGKWRKATRNELVKLIQKKLQERIKMKEKDNG